jgi:hypothetical protein
VWATRRCTMPVGNQAGVTEQVSEPIHGRVELLLFYRRRNLRGAQWMHSWGEASEVRLTITFIVAHSFVALVPHPRCPVGTDQTHIVVCRRSFRARPHPIWLHPWLTIFPSSRFRTPA